MAAMMRRLSRIFCVVGLAVFLGMAVVGQFGWYWVNFTRSSISASGSGVELLRTNNGTWGDPHLGYMRYDVPWNARWLFRPPFFGASIEKGILGFRAEFPWWLLLAIWGIATAITWRVTRRRVEHGFPVEIKTG
jgi:hypothetical protein